MNTERFDATYYRQFYENTRTAIMTPEEQRDEVAFVIAFCRHIGFEIERFADAGAGTGWWAKEFARQYPQCDEIETFDASKAACELYGHKLMRLEKLTGKLADLLVCRDVLRYLPDAAADEAIRRLAKKCRGVLYLQVVTKEDEFDKDASDAEGYFRPTAWYRKRLSSAGFKDCGMGLYVSSRLDFSPWSIELR